MRFVETRQGKAHAAYGCQLTAKILTVGKMMDRLCFFKAQAEDAYARMYEAAPGSELAARYSDAKESLHEAIALAQRLGLQRESERLTARLNEIKTIFRRQFPG
jgi:hypothetical protein